MTLLLVHAAPVEGALVAARHAATLETGVGKTAMAARLTETVLVARPDAVLLFGVCGAYPARHLERDRVGCRVGDLCVIRSDRFVDEGVETEPGFRSIDDLSLGSSGPWHADPALVEALVRALGARLVDAATVSTCSGSERLSLERASRAPVEVESMEGAAAAFVCERHRIPFAQLRCVSNLTGDRERGQWDLEGAVARLASAVTDFAGAH